MAERKGEEVSVATKIAETETAPAPATKPHAQKVAQTLTIEAEKVKKEDLKDIATRIREAAGQLESYFKRFAINIESNRGKVAQDAVVFALQSPLLKVKEEWEKAYTKHKGKVPKELEDQFRERIELAQKAGEAYVDNQIFDSGYITPEKLAAMVEDSNRSVLMHAELFENNKNTDLLEAYKWALGIADKTEENEKKALDTVKKYLLQDNKKLKELAWVVASYMKKEYRLALLEPFRKQPDKLNATLVEGNKAGVFSPDEMLESGMKMTAAEQKKYAETFLVRNNFNKQAKHLVRETYGSYNEANRMLTLKNLGLLVLKLAAGATIGVNVLINAPGAIKSPEAMAGLATNLNIWLGAGVLKGINMYEKGEKLSQIFATQGELDTLSERQAIVSLAKEQKTNPLFKRLDTFFTENQFEGGAVFKDFLDELYKIYGKDLFLEQVTPGSFSDYLKRMAESKSSGKEMKRNADFKGLNRKFNNINPSEIKAYAKIFHALSLGGLTGADRYEKYKKATAEAGLL
ncbi:hypothetical protein HY605_06260 [Candidatus Peregrinibacteria bacterium]|nr:hypothetical protein [Candidatus Peregrinibacteria bacterium]